MKSIYTLFFLILFLDTINASGFHRIDNPRKCDGIHPDALKTKKSVSSFLLRTIIKKEDCIEKIRSSTPKDESKEENSDDPTHFSAQQEGHFVEVSGEKIEKGLIPDSFNQDSDSLKGKHDEFSVSSLNTETKID